MYMRMANRFGGGAFAARYWWHPPYGITIPGSHGSRRSIALNVIFFWVFLGLALVLFVESAPFGMKSLASAELLLDFFLLTS